MGRWIPDDAAFDKFDATRYTPDQLKAIVVYHITPRVQYSTAFQNGPVPTSLNGQSINVAVGSESLTLNGNGRVVAADTFATTGVIHLISEILTPSAFPAVDLPVPVPGSTEPTKSTSSIGASPSQSNTVRWGTTPPSQNGASTNLISGILLGFLIFWIL
jgi:hypothetical protein